MPQDVEVKAREQLATATANQAKPAIPLRSIIANVMTLPAVLDAIAHWLSGTKSISDNPQFDRLRVVDVVRREAHRIQTPIHSSISDGKIARYIHRRMKQLGLTVTRTGRILTELAEPAEATS